MKSRHHLYWITLIFLISPFAISVNGSTITYQMKIYDQTFHAILWILVSLMVLDFVWSRVQDYKFNVKRERKL